MTRRAVFVAFATTFLSAVLVVPALGAVACSATGEVEPFGNDAWTYHIHVTWDFKAAADTGTALEINAYHERLDLNDINARRAAEMGVKVAISTDSHHVDQMWVMELGVRTARRGWLTPANILNTLTTKRLLRALGQE